MWQGQIQCHQTITTANNRSQFLRIRQSIWPRSKNLVINALQKLFTLRESCRGDDKLCEHGSDRCETSAKRVSDDLQFLIFRRCFFCSNNKIGGKILFSDFVLVFYDLLIPRTLQNRAPVEAKRWFLQNCNFRCIYEAWPQNDHQNLCEINEKSMKKLNVWTKH